MKPKKILILGASSDIGIEVVKEFLHDQWNVVAHYNNTSKKLEKLKKNYQGKLQLLKLNLKKINNLNLSKYKKIIHNIDSFVSLTGYLKNNDIEKIDIKNLYDHLNVNFISNIHFLNIVKKNMINKKWGRILLSSSIGTKFGGSDKTYYYSLSKFMNEFIPSEYKKKYAKYILYNVLQIGVTDTKIHNKIPSKNLKSRIKLIPTQKMASTKDVAKKILFLSSERNTLIHNQILNISGGE